MSAFSMLFFNGATGQTMLCGCANVTSSTYIVDSRTKPDYIILCNYSGTINITLPAPSNARFLKIKDASGLANVNNIVIHHHGSEKIDGQNYYTMNSNYQSVELVSDGTNWFLT